MEMMMSAVDGVFAVAEVADTIAQFFQREDVKQVMVKGQELGRGLVLVVALLATVLLCCVVYGVKTICRDWAEALPVAIAAFKEGYAGIEAEVHAELLLLPAAVEEVAIVAETSAKPLNLSQQLRQQCQAAGIRWRNANGQNKHLTVKQMQAALAKGEY